MATVVLAEYNGNWWLVRGDELVAELLYGNMPEDTEVLFQACGSWDELIGMWQAGGGGENPEAQPWVLHPGIVRRLRRTQEPASIAFTPWSAALDDAAQVTIGEAASRLAEHPELRLVLRQYAADGAEPGTADLQRLRHQLVEAALTRHGLAAARIAAETGIAADAAAGQRMDFIEQPVAAAD